jgi:hypothetical protein
MEYIAHVRRLDNSRWDKPQPLEEHLKGSAERAGNFAADFDSRDWGYALGMLHDAGKGTPLWQAYFPASSTRIAWIRKTI